MCGSRGRSASQNRRSVVMRVRICAIHICLGIIVLIYYKLILYCLPFHYNDADLTRSRHAILQFIVLFWSGAWGCLR